MSDRGPPERCPSCGGDVVESPAGWVCDDCDRLVSVIDTRDDRGDDVDT